MNRVYLAGPFSWQQKILGYSKDLESLGYTITSRWLKQEPSFTTPDNGTIVSNSLHDECQILSERDITDIIDGDTLILFEPGIPLERNTRVAEFGGALFTGRKCIVIGPEDEDKKDIISNVFVHLRSVDTWHKGYDIDEELQRIQPVTQYRYWHEFMLDILNPEKVECCAGCGAEYRIRDCGCPIGTFYKWKTLVGNFNVLRPPANIRNSAALATV